MKICIFCSANSNIAKTYFSATEELGRWMAEKGHTVVFGGCDLGLMECIGRTARENGARTIGVVPTKVEERGRTSRHIDVHIPCDNLSDRKELMMTQSDATIGYHSKRIILYNVDGFWDSLIAMLDDLQQRGFVRGSWRDHIVTATNLEEIKRILGFL